MKHNQRLVIIDGIDTTAECVGQGPSLEVRLPLRYVSGYLPEAGAHRDDMAARFLGDVVKSTSAAVVDLVVDFLAQSAPDQEPLPWCTTREFAELEVQRYHDELLIVADAPCSDHGSAVAGAALKYAAALLRAKAVQW